MKEIVYIAFPSEDIEELYPEYYGFYADFKYQLGTVGIEYRPLPLPDIWVRDFLPLQNINDGSLHTMFYDPTYKRAQYKKFYARIRQAVAGLFPQAQQLSIRMDGGNITFNSGGIALALEKASISKNTSYKAVSGALKERLGLGDIIWLPNPHDSCDPFVHIDGFMQFLGDDILLTNKPCDERAAKHLAKCKEIILAKYPQFKIVELPLWVNMEDSFGAKGLYVNFLETSKAVFVPQYKLPQDKEVLAIIRRHTAKSVIGVDCEGISRHGGALHCLTQVVWG